MQLIQNVNANEDLYDVAVERKFACISLQCLFSWESLVHMQKLISAFPFVGKLILHITGKIEPTMMLLYTWELNTDKNIKDNSRNCLIKFLNLLSAACFCRLDVPVCTQWSAKGYFYPIQICQYALSHYSKNLVQKQTQRTVYEDAEKNAQANKVNKTKSKRYFVIFATCSRVSHIQHFLDTMENHKSLLCV